ncbi:MAG: hypothetical protein Fur0022_07060 [Anaerolineales bacterium]
MATYNVYSPFNGTITGLNCYCNAIANPCAPNCDQTGTKCKNKSEINCKTCTNPCFCSCCYHTVVGAALGNCCPMDIAGVSVGTYVVAYLGYNIRSVMIDIMDDVCSANCSVCQGNDIDKGTYVQLYTALNAGGKYLGRILYAHLSNRQYSDGQIINAPLPGSWNIYLGTVPSKPDGQKCYGGPHTHLCVKAESGVSVARNNNLNCDSPVTGGSTAVYTWTY